MRTDTLIVLQLDPERDGAAMLSLPRDLLVTRCDGTVGRINGAFEIGLESGDGGPDCLVETITDLTGIPIHHYVQIDFRGFVNVVDRLGGVRLYLDEPITDPDAHVDLPAGCVTLNGREALGFVRARKIDNDFGRIARQQRFLREFVDQLSSARVALDVPRLFSLVDAAADAVDVDPQLTLQLMRRMAFSFRDLSSDRIDTRTVPAVDRVINEASYLEMDTEPAEELFRAFRRGEAAPEGVGTGGPRKVRVADVPAVRLVDGSGSGLLSTVASALRDRGYELAATQRADRVQRRTVIVHPPGLREDADLLARDLGGARIRQGRPGSGLIATLGADLDLDDRSATESPTEDATDLEPAPTPTFRGATAEGSC